MLLAKIVAKCIPHLQWAPEQDLEQTFAWLKRYFGLKDFQVQGIIAVTRYAFQVHIATLAVAVIAARYQRPELATSRSKVLAFTR